MKLNEQSFEQLFNVHYSVLCQVSIKYVRIPEIAEELVQELFINLWERRHELELRPPLDNYLKKATQNRSINYLKSTVARIPIEGMEDLTFSNDQNPEEELQVKELQEVINTALDSLPERCYMVFSLKRFSALSHREVALKLNISEKTVEHHMSIALKRIKLFVHKYQHFGILLFIFHP